VRKGDNIEHSFDLFERNFDKIEFNSIESVEKHLAAADAVAARYW